MDFYICHDPLGTVSDLEMDLLEYTAPGGPSHDPPRPIRAGRADRGTFPDDGGL
jgi:hypothetical protein